MPIVNPEKLIKNIKEGGKAVGSGMNFFERFWLKKNGPGITIFVVVLAGFITAIIFYKQGVKAGEKNAIGEITSLEKSITNNNKEIATLSYRIDSYKKQLDTCNSSSASSNLEDLVNKRLDEAERLRKILERKLKVETNTNTELKTVPK